MKNISQVLIGAVSAGILATPLSANALTNTFSDEATFLSNVNSGFYLENFNSLSNASQPVAIPFSSGGFDYTVTAIGGAGSLFSDIGNTGSRFLSLGNAADSISISFTSGNVTALGGTFFLTASNSDLISGQQITIALNDGTSVVFTLIPLLSHSQDLQAIQRLHLLVSLHLLVPLVSLKLLIISMLALLLHLFPSSSPLLWGLEFWELW